MSSCSSAHTICYWQGNEERLFNTIRLLKARFTLVGDLNACPLEIENYGLSREFIVNFLPS
jgi:hypothetical protein